MESILEQSSERPRSEPSNEFLGGSGGERRFTNFVELQLDGHEPTFEQLDDVWTLLRVWVRRALQRRGMWNRRPVYLGIIGSGVWVTHETANQAGAPRGGTRDALDELVHEIYVEIFVKRSPTLARYIRRGRAIEAVVRRAVDQAIHDRQSARDPIGQRLYQWLRSAVQKGVESSAIQIVPEGEAIHRTTVLRIGDDPAQEGSSAVEDLETHARRWNDELFVDWLTAKGREADSVVDRLAGLLVNLREFGVVEVRFQVLVEAMTRDTRSRLTVLFSGWQPMAKAWAGGEGDSKQQGAWDDPRVAFEAEDRFQNLAGCVEQRIDGVDAQTRTRDQMRRLWRLLGVWARAMATGPGSNDHPELDDLFKGDGFPSDRELGRLLDLRHDRIKGLMALLKQEIGPCLQSTGSGNLAKVPAAHFSSHLTQALDPEQTLSSTDDFREHLLARTAEANLSTPLNPAPESEAAGVGELCILGDGSGPEIEWLVLGSDDERRLLVPVDSEPWQGSKDVEVAAESPLDGLTARLSIAFWAPVAGLQGVGSASLPETALKPIRRQRIRIHQGCAEVSESAWETDADPDYRSWIQAIKDQCALLAQELGGELESPLKSEASAGEILSGEVLPGKTSPKEAVPGEIEQAQADESYQDESYKVVSLDSHREYRRVPLRSWAAAASVVVGLGLGLIGGRVLDQTQLDLRLSEAKAEKQRLARENLELQTTLEAQKTEAEQRFESLRDQEQARREQSQEAFDSKLRSVESRFEQQLTELDQPELVTGWIFVPPGTQRSGSERLQVSPSARSIMIQVPAQNGDLIRLLRARELIQELKVEGLQPGGDVGLRVPSRLLTAGDYRLEVTRGEEVAIRYRFSISASADENAQEDFWP